MTGRLTRTAMAFVAPMLLFGCVLAPGKFVSTLTINADRSFTFTYKGEVVAIDPGSSLKDASDEEKPKKPAGPTPEAEAKNREIATALAKEAGYRSVVYQGKGKFLIDYAITGVLTHDFIYPFNSDAEVMIPFLAIEVRQGNIVRLRAPGFANSAKSGPPGSGGMGDMASVDASKALDGVLTLDTDAEIVSQNSEDGAKPSGTRKVLSWRATPLTKDPPTAVIRFAR